MDIPGLDAALGTIWCVGRNYADHAKELGHEPPSEPLIFVKPACAAMLSGGTLRLPADSRRVDHEAELVVARARDGSLRMAVGVDFTARDLQAAAKKRGDPWTDAKGRPGFAALGNFVPLRLPTRVRLSVNGAARQDASTADMIFAVERLLAHLDSRFGLRPGDVVYTGTPAGVAPVAAGDRVSALLGEGESRLSILVA